MNENQKEDTANCRNCGKEVNNDIDFCPYCGANKGRKKIEYRIAQGINWQYKEVMLSLFGGFMIIAGMMPFFLENTAISGVTSIIRLRLGVGIVVFALGAMMIIFGVIIPRIRVFIQ